MAKRSAESRVRLSPLGEVYSDALLIEAFCKGRTLSAEAAILICASLYRRAPDRKAMVEELARKRGISAVEMLDQILTGVASSMSLEEYRELRAQSDTGSDESSV